MKVMYRFYNSSDFTILPILFMIIALLSLHHQLLSENKGRKRKFGLRAGVGFHVFYGVRLRDSQKEQLIN